MKKIIRISRKLPVIIIVLFFTVSCNDWLELEPENELIRQEFWKTKDDVDAVLAATYDAFRETALESLIWGELRADLISIQGEGFEDYSRIAQNDISSTNGAVKWIEYYKAINMANTLMQYSGDVIDLDPKFNKKVKENYDAEALFIRSLSYFYLVRLWKQVPLILEASSTDTIDFYKSKSTERTVLNRLIKDLKYAETIARSRKEIYNNEEFRGRANNHSIQALIADIYLWMEDYEHCLEYCDKIINSKHYALETEQNWFNLFYPGNSIESIFEIQFNDNFENENNPMYDRLLPPRGASKRVGHTFNYVELMGSGVDERHLLQGPIYKYIGKSAKSLIFRENTERDANFIYYRYAEILLMKAECLAEMSDFQGAGQLLNDITTRAGNNPIVLSNSLFEYRTAILTERAKEFCFEGKRWFDVLRFAKKDNFAYKHLVTQMILSNISSIKELHKIQARVRDTMFYYLPIPEKDILNNPHLEQNPFYNR